MFNHIVQEAMCSGVITQSDSDQSNLSKKEMEDSSYIINENDQKNSSHENLDKKLTKEHKENQRRTIKLRNISNGKEFEEFYPDLLKSAKIVEEEFKSKSNCDTWDRYCNSLKACISDSSIYIKDRNASHDLFYFEIQKMNNLYYWICLLGVCLLLEVLRTFIE